MKQKLLKTTMKHGSLALLAIGGLMLGSCADHYDGKESWSSSVRNKDHLDSPEKSGIKIIASADGSSFDVSWPVVYGAGGYDVKLIDVTDAETPVVIFDKVVDGCIASMKREDDTRYQLSIKALGNPELNNGEALVATDSIFTTFVEAVDEIPSGTDIAEYLRAKIPADPTKDENGEVVNPTIEEGMFRPDVEGIAEIVPIDLEPDGTYYLNSAVDLRGYRIVLRSKSKTTKAKLIVGEKGRFDITAGFRLRGLDIEIDEANTMPLIKGSSSPLDSIKGRATWELSGNTKRMNVCEPVAVQKCNIKHLKAALIDMSNTEYFLKDFVFTDCRVQCELAADVNAFINMKGTSYINDCKVENCTVWNTGENNYGYFVQYANGGRCPDMGLTSMSFQVNNCTFFNIAKKGQWANYDNFAGAKRNMTTIIYTKNIFVDCGNKQIAKRVLKQQDPTTFAKAKFNQNTYWFDGADVSADEKGDKNFDSGQILTTDPAFVDPVNGDFTPTGEEQVTFQTGDSYWFNK